VRFVRAGGLFGWIADGRAFVQHAQAVGVNELACLMDFGVDHAMVLESFPYLIELQTQVQAQAQRAAAPSRP
jgi:hypothetical protein